MTRPEEIAKLRKRLEIHRRKLALYLEQLAIHGTAHVPPAIDQGICEEREAIKNIKTKLRTLGVKVEDHPDDEELPDHEGQPSPIPLPINLSIIVTITITLAALGIVVFGGFAFRQSPIFGQPGTTATAIIPTLAPTVTPPEPTATPSLSPTLAPTPTVTATPPPSSTPAVTSTATSALVCGESHRVALPVPPLVRNQGVVAFTAENMPGAVLSDFVRSLAIDQRGVWIGYFATAPNAPNGLGHYNGKDWADCNHPDGTAGKDINAIAIDKKGNLWAATWKNGVVMFDGKTWHSYTRVSTNYVLPSDETFGITVDDQNNVWVGTLEGVAKFDGTSWGAPYTKENGTLQENPVHAIAFDSAQNIWIGHIRAGISMFSKDEGKWIYFSTKTGGPGGDQIRSIVVRKGEGQSPESIWFATFDGGVSKYEQGKWTVYNTTNGLPSNEAHALAIDKYNRVWAATASGVMYFDGAKWNTYNTINTFSIAFGPKDCSTCPFDDDSVWTGTQTMGLTHSRVPYPDKAIDIVSVNYPKVVAPGQTFAVTITVRPRSPYELREPRDFLGNTDASDDLLFGAHEHIAVKGIVASGDTYTFVSYDDKPFIAPQLAPGEKEHTYTSTWRVWMHTRYAGDPIPITFTVRRR